MEFTTYLRFVVALILVIGLILGFAWVMRRFGFGSGLQGALGRKRRIGTVKSVAIDSRHRIVLVRRDDVEHLLLIGPNTSQVIERGIPAPPGGLDQTPSSGLTAFSQFLPKDKQ